MHKVRVGVLRGGPGKGYEQSLKTGETVMRHLPLETYDVHDILISREGAWHKHGLEITPHHALSHIDVVWNALQPATTANPIYHILELHRIPFTGSGVFASAVGSNPLHFKEILRRENVKTLPFRLVEIPKDESPGDELTDLFRTFSPPLIIRPIVENGEANIARTFEAFTDALSKAFEASDSVMIEEHIPGTHVSVGIIEDYRGKARYALSPLNARGIFSEEKKRLEDLAAKVHDILGFRHYSSVDFLVSPRRGIFVSGASTSPDFHEESHLHGLLENVGAPLSHFLDHVVELALRRKV